MDIIKSILHVFKKSDNAFKVMHPETESACITDWNTGIVNTLASTGLSSLVNVLSSDSLLALLIKKVFDATGVKYSLGQNGYVCFGSLVGGLIIQWGRASGTPNDSFSGSGITSYEAQFTVNTPIQFKNSALFAVADVLTDAENVVDEKAECSNLETWRFTLKISSSRKGATLTVCYFILGY